MNRKGPEGKIIFVNSYKGGAGKTTLSLTHCIDDLFHEKKYENVVYMDLDILGTATCYLFDESRLTVDKCFNYTQEAAEIELKSENDAASLYVAYLNPNYKNRSMYGEEYYINHQALASEILQDKIWKFIEDCLKSEPSTLLVLDCAPGFSDLEQKLLIKCYDLALKGKVELLEEYVTTLDAAHIRKSIQCLKDSQENFEIMMKNRSIRITINDVQNFTRWLKETGTDDAEQKWLEIAQEIRKELGDIKAEIYRWRYSEEIAVRNTFTSQEKIENQVEDYVFTGENYKEL